MRVFMRPSPVFCLLVFSIIGVAQDSIKCDTTSRGDESLTVCTGPDQWKSVLQCNRSGCSSETGQAVDEVRERLAADAQYRDSCKFEIEQTMKGQTVSYRPSYCERLKLSDVQYDNPSARTLRKQLEEAFNKQCKLETQSKKKSLFDTGCMESEWAKREDALQEENHRLNQAVLAKVDDRDNALRLQLCEKGIFDKTYCNSLKNKLNSPKQ